MYTSLVNLIYSIFIDSDDIVYEIRHQVLVFTKIKGQYFGSFGYKGELDQFAVTL